MYSENEEIDDLMELDILLDVALLEVFDLILNDIENLKGD